MDTSRKPNFNCLSKTEQDLCKQYIELGDNADFIKKGIAFCHSNPSNGILLTGINPSGEGGANCFYTFKDAINKIPPSQYWKNKKKQIVGNVGNDSWLLDHTAYLDLFPYFESNQEEFENALNANIEFQVKVLEITQKNIEEYIQPKLIIAANDRSAYYWGFRPDTTWLGYDFIKVDDIPDCLKGKRIPLFQINPNNGFRKANDRVGQDKYQVSKIKGSYFIPYAMYDDRHYSMYPDKILTPEIVKNIFEWINNQ